jgi:hypothetical protein
MMAIDVVAQPLRRPLRNVFPFGDDVVDRGCPGSSSTPQPRLPFDFVEMSPLNQERVALSEQQVGRQVECPVAFARLRGSYALEQPLPRLLLSQTHGPNEFVERNVPLHVRAGDDGGWWRKVESTRIVADFDAVSDLAENGFAAGQLFRHSRGVRDYLRQLVL